MSDPYQNTGCYGFLTLSSRRKNKSNTPVNNRVQNFTSSVGHVQEPPSYFSTMKGTVPVPEDVLKTMEDKISEIDSSLRELSLYIHDNPELLFKEELAHDALAAFMEKHEFTVTRQYLGLKTAWRASFKNGTDGPVLGINSEMDALPGLGHACGHNLIAISGVAVAVGVKTAMKKHNIPGEVILLGTPAEEGGGGKVLLLDRGGYDGMDVCIMCHPGPGSGTSFTIPNSLAIQTFDVEYLGKTAHASADPWDGINALDAAVLAYSSISALRQQIRTDQRVHGIIRGRDWAANIIPDYAKLEYIVRGPTAGDVKLLQARVISCFEAAALATGCRCKITLGLPYEELVQNLILAEEYINVATNRYGLQLAPNSEFRASTDFGNVSQVIPSLHPGYEIPASSANHTAGFAEAAATQFAHNTTLLTTKALSVTGLRVLLDRDFLKSVKESFKQRHRVNRTSHNSDK